jgi:hypothetical protein
MGKKLECRERKKRKREEKKTECVKFELLSDFCLL